ncbi:MAG: hypothetical protein ACYCW6_08235 [Candidatus Xenobia bacterium]
MLLLFASNAVVDDEPRIDFVESGGIDFTAVQNLMHSAVREQLQDICDAMQEGRLADGQVDCLLSEVEDWLIGEMRRFQGFPEPGVDAFEIGRRHVLTGLEMLSEACLVVRYAETLAGLSRALSIAREADDELRRGCEQLDRAADMLQAW